MTLKQSLRGSRRLRGQPQDILPCVRSHTHTLGLGLGLLGAKLSKAGAPQNPGRTLPLVGGGAESHSC